MSCQNPCTDAVERTSSESFEVVRIPKTTFSCSLCEDYAKRQATKPLAVMCCEGACLRGEIARQAANFLSYSLLPDQAARICLGGAFTKDTGQRSLVRNALRLVAIEGCSTKCATRMMQGVLGTLLPEIFIADSLCDFDVDLFGIEQMPEAEIKGLARTVAERIAAKLAMA